jgi:hypothetical protein
MKEKSYIWVSGISPTTCKRCKEQNGKEYSEQDVNFLEAFGEGLPPLHPNCRCKLVEKKNANSDMQESGLTNIEAFLYGAENVGVGIASLFENFSRLLGAAGMSALGLTFETIGILFGKGEELSKPFYKAADFFSEEENSLVSTWKESISERYGEDELDPVMRLIAILDRVGGTVITGAAAIKLLSSYYAWKSAAEAHPPTKYINYANARYKLLEGVKNQRLINAISEIYRKSSTFGDGGTADALRYELSTGISIGGKSHIQKAFNSILCLMNILMEENLTYEERSVAWDMILNLINALGGN